MHEGAMMRWIQQYGKVFRQWLKVEEGDERENFSRFLLRYIETIRAHKDDFKNYLAKVDDPEFFRKAFQHVDFLDEIQTILDRRRQKERDKETPATREAA